MLITALATPLTENYEIDIRSYHRLLQHQKMGGIDGVVIAGTTGQGTLLNLKEKEQLLLAASDYALNRGFCISDTSISRVFENMEIAEKYEASFLLVTPPFFVKPTQEAIIHFFEKVLENASCPVILYNNPSRVGVKIEESTYSALKGKKNLWGTKESAQKPSIEGIEIPVFSGDDEMTVTYYKQGAIGAISVLSNVFPKLLKQIPSFPRVNPLAIQYMLKLAGIFTHDHVRLEVGELTAKQKQTVESLWKECLSLS